jgi:Holliday junction resolvasome RuvABC endonuclease subunit
MATPGVAVEDETEISVPKSQTDRGAKLSWLLEEAEELLRRLRPDVLYVKKSPGGQKQSSREQHEVEAVVQVAAHRVSVACVVRTTEQVRAAHVPKGKGAYKQLLERKDVKARGNKRRRESYLYASTALSDSIEAQKEI